LEYEEAAEWYTKAALQGHPRAQFALVNLYEKGLGVELSPTKARLWAQRSAESGHPEAIAYLRQLLEKHPEGE
tara:strand:- start:11 stop:229 length:219 start_codon:yes stop_codon:yes gene_type:complete